jgi:[protein-PII] uridylyltransferase
MTSAFEELKESKEHLTSLLSEGGVPENFQEEYTEIIDQYFRKSLQESETAHALFKDKTRFAFVAVGGYGRKELCLYSDIDIQILFGSKIPPGAKKLAGEIFYPLWDLGLDLGFGIRTIKDSISLSKDDFEVLTSVMDARFVGGHSPVYLSLMYTLQKKIVSKKANAFGRWLEDQHKIRMHNFGDASHLLEPNLKEGIGALRDYHHIMWLARAFFNLRAPRDLEYMGKLSHSEYKTLRDHLEFIWVVRNHLHQLSGRKNDRMVFEYQEEIAKRLGFKDQKNLLSVEQFMGRVHASMASIKSLYRSFVTSHTSKWRRIKSDTEDVDSARGLQLSQGELNINSATCVLSDPFLLIQVFEQSSRLACSLSMEAKRLVREFLFLVDDAFRKSKRVVQSFLNIMTGENTFEALDQMYETGFLEALIPEFGKVKDRVQFDAYHIFPVGRHSLETVRHLKSLTKERDILLLDIYSDLSNPGGLFLAGLFHDIGKVGKDHAHKGVAITRKILKRFDYYKKGVENVLFLVEHHLFLAETATRRDLNDEKVVIQCARTIGDVERLKMLYLLTWADSKATGPGAWSEWTANLVQELFFKTLHILVKGELATPHAFQKVKKTHSEARNLMADHINDRDFEGLFGAMSPRYLLETSPYEIVRHCAFIRRLKEQLENPKEPAFILEAREEAGQGCWEVTFLAKDRPGLFSDIAGVMALNNINILSAHIYTWRDGTAVDIFRVTSPLDLIHTDETWERMKRDLKNTFTGKLSLDYRLSQKAAPCILSYRKKPSRPPKVTVDNEASDFFTLIEIFADDRVGLLYMITYTLFNLKLDIRIAKIATKADQIADVFYVRDLEGQKVEDNKKIEEINKTLIHKLKQG